MRPIALCVLVVILAALVAMVPLSLAQTDAGATVAAAEVTSPGPVATPPTDEGVLVDAIGDVVRGDSAARAIAVIALVGLVWLMRRFGRSPLPVLGWRLLPAWFGGDRGGVVLTFALAFVGAFGHALAAGVAVSLSLLWSALLVALTAIGGYAGARRLLWPPDGGTPPTGDFTRLT